jgi:hypothetical protein
MKRGHKSTPERRSDARNKIRKVGRIFVDGAGKAVPCIILDLSDTGALLLVHDKVPDQFSLYYSAKKVLRDVTVVRRLPDAIGVRFDSDEITLQPGDPRLEQIRAS